jgi:hypothetical protein
MKDTGQVFKVLRRAFTINISESGNLLEQRTISITEYDKGFRYRFQLRPSSPKMKGFVIKNTYSILYYPQWFQNIELVTDRFKAASSRSWDQRLSTFHNPPGVAGWTASERFRSRFHCGYGTRVSRTCDSRISWCCREKKGGRNQNL